MRATLRTAPALALLLATSAAGCGDDPAAPPTGEVRVTVTTAGDDPDENGYTVMVDDAARGTVQPNGVFTVSGVSRGEHEVRLEALSVNCGADENPRVVQVTDAATADVAFAVTCAAMVGSLRVTAETDGPEPDANGYMLKVNGAQSAGVPANGVVVIPGVRAGAISLEFTEIAENCEATVVDSAGAQVAFAETLDILLVVDCHGTAALRVIAASSGTDVGTGYAVRVRPAATEGHAYDDEVSASGEVVIEEIGAGEYDVSLAQLPPNCDVSGAATSRIVLVSGETGVAAFDVVCVEAPLLMFATWEDGGSDIATIKSNATGYARITRDAAYDASPDWAPGGARVVFMRGDYYDLEIYTMAADGSDVVRLTNNSSEDRDPAWSPDGSRIAFVSTRTGRAEIHVMLADGSDVTRLTNTAEEKRDPTWSPDGARILFADGAYSTGSFQVMNADGSDVQTLTAGNPRGWAPVWSPDGTRIAYLSCGGVSCFNTALVVMKLDGSGSTVVHNDELLYDPAWSPDGEWLAFGTSCYYYCSGASGGLRVARADGTGDFFVLEGFISSPSWRR